MEAHPTPSPILLKRLALSHAVARTASPGVSWHPRSPHFPVRSPRALDEVQHCPPSRRSGILGTWGRSSQGSSCSYPRSPRHFPRRSCFKGGPAHRVLVLVRQSHDPAGLVWKPSCHGRTSIRVPQVHVGHLAYDFSSSSFCLVGEDRDQVSLPALFISDGWVLASQGGKVQLRGQGASCVCLWGRRMEKGRSLSSLRTLIRYQKMTPHTN